jgi:hypothetical protein
MRLRYLMVVLALIACAGPAGAAASLKMQIGAAEDEGRNSDPAVARAKVELAKAAGFDALRITAIWTPGQNKVDADQLLALQAVASAAVFDGIQLTVTVMPFGSKTTPLTATARKQFASFAADVVKRVPLIHTFIIGNEPNINRYWLPQFGPNGEDVAANAYEQLLAQTYDAVKAVDKKAFVAGGSVSPHGGDDPTASRKTHSPTAFITDLGAAYRVSRRVKPIMDGFAFHPYGENSSVAPTVDHPRSTSIGIADYDKLVALLGKAFDGTAQIGSTLPIIYDEYGIESLIPSAKLKLYHGIEPSTTKPVPTSTQADYYDEALTMAACQPNVRAIFIFHVTDETDRNRWQSGVYYPDGTPKLTRAAVKATITQIHSGAVDCSEGLSHENDGWTLVAGTPRRSRATGKTQRHKKTQRSTKHGPKVELGSRPQFVGTT